MAKKVGTRAKGGGAKGPKILLLLVGFVLVTVGVNFRRVYGRGQAKQIREMEQRREALVSEQHKVQEAIRVASDRQHIMEVAQSRLGMKLPDLHQVIDITRRPLPSERGRDSVRR
jgi:cell division protein FtsL